MVCIDIRFVHLPVSFFCGVGEVWVGKGGFLYIFSFRVEKRRDEYGAVLGRRRMDGCMDGYCGIR